MVVETTTVLSPERLTVALCRSVSSLLPPPVTGTRPATPSPETEAPPDVSSTREMLAPVGMLRGSYAVGMAISPRRIRSASRSETTTCWLTARPTETPPLTVPRPRRPTLSRDADNPAPRPVASEMVTIRRKVPSSSASTLTGPRLSSTVAVASTDGPPGLPVPPFTGSSKLEECSPPGIGSGVRSPAGP